MSGEPLDEDFNPIDIDIPSKKINFNTAVFLGMIRCQELLGRLNEIPPHLVPMMQHLSEDDLRPNRINYVFAVKGLRITLHHIVCDNINSQAIKESLRNIDNGEYKDEVSRAMAVQEQLMLIMYQAGLLPTQML